MSQKQARKGKDSQQLKLAKSYARTLNEQDLANALNDAIKTTNIKGRHASESRSPSRTPRTPAISSTPSPDHSLSKRRRRWSPEVSGDSSPEMHRKSNPKSVTNKSGRSSRLERGSRPVRSSHASKHRTISSSRSRSPSPAAAKAVQRRVRTSAQLKDYQDVELNGIKPRKEQHARKNKKILSDRSRSLTPPALQAGPSRKQTSEQLNVYQRTERNGRNSRTSGHNDNERSQDRIESSKHASQKESHKKQAGGVTSVNTAINSTHDGASGDLDEEGVDSEVSRLRKTVKSLKRQLKQLQIAKQDSDDHALDLSKKLEASSSGKEFAKIKFSVEAGIDIGADEIEELSEESSSDSMFVGRLLMRLLGPDELLKLSATGQACRRFASKKNSDGTPAYPALEALDKNIMTFLCNKVAERNQRTLGSSKIARIRAACTEKKIRGYVTQKIANHKRAFLARERNNKPTDGSNSENEFSA